MPFLIGTDEAGYGPNLGPLVIAASVWHIDDAGSSDLFERLRDIVCCGTSNDRQRLAIADSKVLYKSGGGIQLLERGVLAALGLLGHQPRSVHAAWKCLSPATCQQFASQPWHEGRDELLPRVAQEDELPAIAARLQTALSANGVRLVALEATTIFPDRFNALIDQYGSKGEALSRATLELASRMLAHCREQPALLVCDKHGGRARYQRLLQEQFPEPLIEVIREGLAESVYRWGPPHERVEACFRAKGEGFLPAALASMTAKYLRELAMDSFNRYWSEHVADLRPTAGYPLDAKRFRADIAHAQKKLGISDRVLWRER